MYDQADITKASRATVIVPAAGPNNKTEVKTNVSETEIVAGREGSLIVAEPLTSVSKARTIQLQSFGLVTKSVTDWIMIESPAITMQMTYARVRGVKELKVTGAITTVATANNAVAESSEG